VRVASALSATRTGRGNGQRGISATECAAAARPTLALGTLPASDGRVPRCGSVHLDGDRHVREAAEAEQGPLVIPLILVVVGQVFLSPPRHAPIRRSVEVSIFRQRGGFYVTSLRTNRDGTFRQRLIADDYYFRVRPTRKPYCHTTAVGIHGSQRGQRVRVSIRVPTMREHRCKSFALGRRAQRAGRSGRPPASRARA
jgi:hypothetical protein